ncbi:arsenate-mycothiol transferase ArsC [Asticcacaulis taihuensis]|uniref:Low molecular weight phosphotyrosine protein phosphatase n=1 Tax=Asticcacaulis taihuensis TaxID=260084 RepID=A0A1G4RBJ6_9CAUL|nr:hypothetical protein [Asticcacaulis taihuensis]SCW54293.1 Low molecular weight phosphotyrosine protein phosphatase [Asticcacaulis taihuensis]
MTTGLRTFNVLFLCADNSVRSILAEALLNRLGAGRFQAFSAGYGVAEAVSPHALALLEKINYNSDRVHAKQMAAVMDAADPGFDFIIRLSPDRRGSALECRNFQEIRSLSIGICLIPPIFPARPPRPVRISSISWRRALMSWPICPKPA